MQSRKRLKHQFEFIIHVHNVKLPETYSPRLAVSCSRGTTAVSTQYTNGVSGSVCWNTDLRLEIPMFYDVKSARYDKKKCTIKLKQMKSNGAGAAKTVGFTEIDLSEFTKATVPLPLELPLNASSVPDIVLSISVSSNQIVAALQSSQNDDELASVFSDAASAHYSEISSLAPDNEYLDELMEEISTPVELTAHNLAQFTDRQGSPRREPRFSSPQRARVARGSQLSRRFSSPLGAGLQRSNVEGLTKLDAAMREVQYLRHENEFLRRKASSHAEDGFYHNQQELALVSELEQAQTQIKILEDQLALEKQAHVNTREKFQADIQQIRNQTEKQAENHLKERLQNEQLQTRRELEFHRKIADWQNKCSDLQRDHRRLQQQHDEQKTVCSKLRVQNSVVEDRLRETTKKYMGCLATLKASKSRLRQKVGTQQGQIDDLEASLLMVRNSWNDTAKLMEKQIDDLSTELNATKVKLAIAEDNQRQMEAELAPIRNHAQRLQSRHEKTEDKLLQHEMTLAKQTVELTTLRTQLLAAHGDNDHLTRTLAQLSAMTAETNRNRNGKGRSNSVMAGCTPTKMNPPLSRSKSMIMGLGGRGSTIGSISPSEKNFFKGCSTFASRSSSISSYKPADESLKSPHGSFSLAGNCGSASRSGSLSSVASSSTVDSTPSGSGRKVLKASGRDLLSTYSSSSSVDKADVSTANLRERLEEADDRLSELSGDEAEDMIDVE